MAQATTERDLKLGVWPGFELPSLDGAIDGATADRTKTRRLEAVYFDTPDLRLLRRGGTLGFRRGEEPAELWTARLPVESGELALARQEMSLTGGRGSIPPDLADLVRG